VKREIECLPIGAAAALKTIASRRGKRATRGKRARHDVRKPSTLLTVLIQSL
jgi:hypothetical protein